MTLLNYDGPISENNPLNINVVSLDAFDKATKHIILATKNSKSGIIVLAADGESYKSTFTEEYSTAQTATAILTPTVGYKICVKNVHLTGNGTNGEVQVDFLTSGKKVSRLYVAKRSRDWFSLGGLSGVVDEPLSLTTTTGVDKVFILINYIERP